MKNMYNPASLRAEEFINHQEILDTLQYGSEHKNDRGEISRILNKARTLKGLSHREAFVLLCCELDDLNQQIYELAKEIKLKFYGHRIVLFAPLYLSNYCINGCVYCPYHLKNKHLKRKKLTMDEILKETVALQDMGHKRLVLEAGEDPLHNPIEYILDAIRTVYSVHHKNGDTRRVNINIAATTVENYRLLHEAGIGTYILFQETYHKERYQILHPTGPKSDYAYHTEAMDRAMTAGIDDVGIGVLFGLQNYRYDFIGLLMHREHLEARFGVGPHTISVPRIRQADDIDPDDFSDAISDDIFEKIIACIRISTPYTGMILSTRESEKTRARALELGISQISGGSKTSVGGYDHSQEDDSDGSEQFDTVDKRSLDDVVHWLLSLNHIPSFCTACYRAGRTGDRFMSLVKSGEIANICQPNALLTLQEYLEDYASVETKILGEKLIETELSHIVNPQIRKKTQQWLQDIRNGERDIRL